MASLNHIVCDLFQLPATGVDDETSPRTVGRWDSMRHIELIMRIESEFGIRFEPSEVPGLTSLGSIRRLLASRGLAAEPATGA